MPYYIHAKDENPAELDLTNRTPYPTRQLAFTAAEQGQKVAYLVGDTGEQNDWQYREHRRFEDGAYLRTPWHGENRYYAHYVHQSTDKPGMVAYTRDDEQGYLDRQVRTTPGRYLEQFYGDVPLEIRQRWIAICLATDEGVSIATTADDIERVYRAKDYERPYPIQSCMGPQGHATFDIWPVRAYGDSDLAVAYLGPMDAPIARAVVWPAKKLYTRCYGDNYRLEKLLCRDGYSRGPMRGARIRRIEHPDGGYVMPYVDGISVAEERGKYLVLGYGSIATDVTNGQANPEDTERCCDHCGDSYQYDENEDSGYCPSCDQDRNYCDGCGNDSWDGRYVESEGEYRCDSCIDRDARQHECEVCGTRFSEWQEEQDENHDDRVTGRFINRVCQSCVDGDNETLPVRICHVCDAVIDDVPGCCPECMAVPRCHLTADLLAVLSQPIVEESAHA